MYRKKFGSWQLEQILTAGDGTADDQFGQSVEVRGEMIIVGASGAANGNDVKSGAVYLFHRVAGTWEETAKIYADDGQDGDQFGFSVDISSGVIGVGARWADVEEAVDAGAAYLFRKAEGDWTQIGKLTASNAAEGDEFGHSLAMTGPLVAVGANLTDVDGRVDQGTVYLFSRPGDGWEEIDQLNASGGLSGDRYGQALAAHSNKLVVGAWATDVDEPNQGAAYTYLPWQPKHAKDKVK
ncbi:FG-GAP repeat protein [Desulfosarcina cetonica]|uniref:FG-GAP repeat protein n=1 Tax=Desulfosarcina cetonica TaxID=90730 RepID=UPI000AF3E578|nr:FG-GAP repeat protein [Desulfosarcina cetonica]